MCPGNNESAGKRKTGKTAARQQVVTTDTDTSCMGCNQNEGNLPFRAVSEAGSATRKETGCRCDGHTILVAAYQMLKHRVEWRVLGGDYFARRNPEKTTRSLVKRLQALEYEVDL